MSEDILHYPIMIDQAMRGVVRDVLKRVSSSGLPAEHHFYISFSTTYPGVKISDTLKSRYPKEITIVLQHQFWDFKVEEQYFNVTLSFGGVPEKLSIPFAALTAFADPSVKFGLQFQQTDMFEAEIVTPEVAQAAVVAQAESIDKAAGAEIISLESFRKK
jgi:hypothetical protein